MKSAAEVRLDSLVRLVNTYEKAITDTAWCTGGDILLETDHPAHDPARDGWCVVRPQGDVVAWAALTTRGGPSLDCTLTVLPDDDGSIARELLALLLARAGELSREQGGGHEITVCGVLNGDPVVPPVLQEAGFTRQITYNRCEIDLSLTALPTVSPEGGHIRRIDSASDDVRTLHDIHNRTRTTGARMLGPEVFRARLEQFGTVTARQAGISLLLEFADTPAGYVLAQAWEGRGRIVDVAVAPAFRGRSAGLALVSTALDRLREFGCDRALLALDTSRVRYWHELHGALAVTGEYAVTQYVKYQRGSAHTGPGARSRTRSADGAHPSQDTQAYGPRAQSSGPGHRPGDPRGNARI
ncbi:GNAT family N-acetyltransferase [Streptomyces verrucosisporus]|uniref:GNAT family N-acetyltransferase n=1 Tax=Streptomyces verrucosisporus TaxID=1695161 RepID=UPI0019D2CE69|nr:GNAT family N-acetyltransferase [Streptomyces verrucosisporus]MBN3933092.1 GNAT family N-acetyltransferase [Streptomyces verrucosisporus]